MFMSATNVSLLKLKCRTTQQFGFFRHCICDAPEYSTSWYSTYEAYVHGEELSWYMLPDFKWINKEKENKTDILTSVCFTTHTTILFDTSLDYLSTYKCGLQQNLLK